MSKKILSFFNIVNKVKESQQAEFEKNVKKDSIDNFNIEQRKDLNGNSIVCITFKGVIVLIQNAPMTSEDLIGALFELRELYHNDRINGVI